MTRLKRNNIINKRYTYDGLGRLVQEYNADFGKTFNYSYDNAGNITQKSYEQTNSQGQSEQIAKTYAYTNGRLTNFNGYTILYDEIGNPVTCFNNSVEWTHGHRLKKYHGAEFEYNYAGIRLKKTANGKTTKYALEGDKIIAIEQTYGNTTQNMIFYYGVDGVSGFEYEGEQYFYRKNIFGDILGIYKNAELIVKYAYDAWGENKTYVSDGSNWVLLENSTALDSNSDYARNVRIAKLNPFLYRGYCFDRETGLYYLNARYYDPQIGRFICPDSIEYLDPTTINGLNLYAYCGNDPVNKSDPSGHFGILALVAITAASMLIGGTAQLVSNAMAGKTGSELWRGVAGATVGAGVNALALCLAMPTGGASLFIAAGTSAIVQTGVDTLETVIRGEEVDVGQTFIDLGLNFVTTLAGNYLGGKMIPTNSGWFQTQKFLSVFTKSYGQKILLQTAIGAGLSGIVNFVRTYNKEKLKPVVPDPNLPATIIPA